MFENSSLYLNVSQMRETSLILNSEQRFGFEFKKKKKLLRPLWEILQNYLNRLDFMGCSKNKASEVKAGRH